MRIARELFDEMVAHAREDAPNECCGMVATRDGQAVKVYRAANAAASPLRYEIDGAEQYRIQMEIDDQDLELGAIYHSHTRSEPVPSQTDINLAFYPEALYVIVGLAGGDADVRAFTDPRRTGDRGRLGSELMAKHGAVSEPLICPGCGSTHAPEERFCRSCHLPLVHPSPGVEPSLSASATSARARSSRSSPRDRWCGWPARATRPRPSSSRACCSRRGSPACSSGAPASTCPTSSRPVPATCWSPRPDCPRLARSCSRPRSSTTRPRWRVVAPGRLMLGLLAALVIGALVVWLFTVVVHD